MDDSEKSEITKSETLLKVALIAKIKQQFSQHELSKEYINGLIKLIKEYEVKK